MANDDDFLWFYSLDTIDEINGYSNIVLFLAKPYKTMQNSPEYLLHRR